MEALAQLASAAIALLALGVSIWVAWKQGRIAREQTAIQKQLAAIEEARRAEEVAARAEQAAASGRARVTLSKSESENALVLHNEGPALAGMVTLEHEGLSPKVRGLAGLPVDLQPGQRLLLPLIPLSLGEVPILRATVRWTDEGGDHEVPYTVMLG